MGWNAIIEDPEGELKIPEEFRKNFLNGLLALLGTGINCEAALLLFMLNEYDSTPIVKNDQYFREQFRCFCDKYGERVFVDSTIKKALRSLRTLHLLEQPEYGLYKLHKRFFLI